MDRFSADEWAAVAREHGILIPQALRNVLANRAGYEEEAFRAGWQYGFWFRVAHPNTGMGRTTVRACSSDFAEFEYGDDEEGQDEHEG